MAQLYVARRTNRGGLYLPMEGTKKKPALMFFLPKCDKGQLDQLIRKQLADQGITNESRVQAIVDAAEKEYERQIKVKEAQAELRRLMQLKLDGAKLIQRGFRKWVPANFRPVNKGA